MCPAELKQYWRFASPLLFATVVACAEGAAPSVPAVVAFVEVPATATAGAPFSPSVRVAIRDDRGNTVANATSEVTISIADGSGTSAATLGGTHARSAVAGIAVFDDLTIDKAGSGFSLRAASSGLAAATSTTFTVTHAQPAKLAVSTQPANAIAGSALSPNVAFTIQDAFGNTVTSSSAEVTVSITSGSGASGATLAGTLTRPAVNGVATFSELSIDRAAGGYTLTASSAGLTGAVTSPFSISPGGAAKLAVTVQPTTVSAGATISPAVQVALQDNLGNLVTSANALVAVAIASGTGTSGATLAGTLSATTSSGIATFSDLSINKSGGGYALAMSAPSLSDATSSTFSVTAAAATTIASNAGDNQTSEAGNSTVVTPSVKVADAFENPVPGVPVTFAITSGSGALSGANQTTGPDGIATVGLWALGAAAGTNTMTATAAGLTGSPVTFTATGVPGIVGIINPSGDGFDFVHVQRGTGTRAVVRRVTEIQGINAPVASDILSLRYFLQGFDQSSVERLFTIDARTGVIAQQPAVGSDGISNIQYDRRRGVLAALTFRTGVEELVRVNPQTGAVTSVGFISEVATIQGSAAFDHANDRYLFIGTDNGGTERLYTLNAATGAVVFRPAIGDAQLSNFQYDSTSGQAVGLTFRTGVEELLRVNLQTGAVSTIGTLSEVASITSSAAISSKLNLYFFIGIDINGTERLYGVDLLTGAIRSRPAVAGLDAIQQFIP